LRFLAACHNIGLCLNLYFLLGKTKTQTNDAAEYLQDEVDHAKVQAKKPTLLVLKSLSLIMPAPLLRTEIGSHLRALPAIKDFGQWNMALELVSETTSLQVCGWKRPRFFDNVSPTLQSGLRPFSGHLLVVIIHLVHSAQLHWALMSSWIGTFYHRLLGYGRLDETDAWDIVSQSVHALFEQLRVIRATAQDSDRHD